MSKKKLKKKRKQNRRIHLVRRLMEGERSRPWRRRPHTVDVAGALSLIELVTSARLPCASNPYHVQCRGGRTVLKLKLKLELILKKDNSEKETSEKGQI
jgi:hypothetical protein